MSILTGVLSLAVAWALGWAWLLPITGISRPLRVGLSYGLGLTWLAVAIGIVGLIGLPVTLGTSGWAILLPPVVWVLWHLRTGGIRTGIDGTTAVQPPRQRVEALRDHWWWAILTLVASLWAVVTARALVKPISTWDGMSHSLKAKAILVDAVVSPALLQWVGNAHYPLGIPLQQIWVGWIVGEWNDLSVKLIFPGYLLALFLLVYAVLRDTCAPRVAIFGTLFVAGLPFLLQHGQCEYADLPMAYFAVANAATLTLYARSSRRTMLALAAACAVGLLLVRPDGPLLTASTVALLVVMWACKGLLTRHSTWGDLGVYVWPQALAWGGWELAKLQMGIAISLSDQSAADVSQFDRSLAVFSALIDAMFVQGNWMILWALFFVAFISRFRDTLTTESLFLVWPVIAYLIGIMILSVATGQYQFISEETFLNRMVLHVAPLAALWVTRVYAGALPSPAPR